MGIEMWCDTAPQEPAKVTVPQSVSHSCEKIPWHFLNKSRVWLPVFWLAPVFSVWAPTTNSTFHILNDFKVKEFMLIIFHKDAHQWIQQQTLMLCLRSPRKKQSTPEPQEQQSGLLLLWKNKKEKKNSFDCIFSHYPELKLAKCFYEDGPTSAYECTRNRDLNLLHNLCPLEECQRFLS